MFFIKNRVCERSSLTELGIVIRRCIAVMHFFFQTCFPKRENSKLPQAFYCYFSVIYCLSFTQIVLKSLSDRFCIECLRLNARRATPRLNSFSLDISAKRSSVEIEIAPSGSFSPTTKRAKV